MSEREPRTASHALLTAVALGALALAGCGSQITVSPAAQAGASPPPAQIVAIGQPVAVKVNGASVTLSVLSIRYHRGALSALGPPPQNGQYAGADVLIKVTAGQFTYNASYVRYQAADERLYMFGGGNASVASYGPELTFGTLAAGQSARGFVTFDVPAGAGQDVQILDPLGDVLGEWKPA